MLPSLKSRDGYRQAHGVPFASWRIEEFAFYFGGVVLDEVVKDMMILQHNT